MSKRVMVRNSVSKSLFPSLFHQRLPPIQTMRMKRDLHLKKRIMSGISTEMKQLFHQALKTILVPNGILTMSINIMKCWSDSVLSNIVPLLEGHFLKIESTISTSSRFGKAGFVSRGGSSCIELYFHFLLSMIWSTFIALISSTHFSVMDQKENIVVVFFFVFSFM